jgi:hypothetical protein
MITAWASTVALACMAPNMVQQSQRESALSWPRVRHTPTALVSISQPHIDDFSGAAVRGKMAVEVSGLRGVPDFRGTANFVGDAVLDRAARTIRIGPITVPALRMETAPEHADAARQTLTSTLAGITITVAFDDLTAVMRTVSFPDAAPLPDCSGTRSVAMLQVNDPPPPDGTIAVRWLGTPAFESVIEGRLEGAVNSSSMLLREPSGRHLLLHAGRWLEARSFTAPQWTWIGSDAVPPVLLDIAETSRWGSALSSVPGTLHSRIAELARQIASPVPAPSDPPCGGDDWWWNPWSLRWVAACTSPAPTLPSDSPVDHTVTPRTPDDSDAFQPDVVRDNLLVGLDGRVYRRRGESFEQSTPTGGWRPFTTERSVLRILRVESTARDAAQAVRRTWKNWRMHDAEMTPATRCDSTASLGSRPLRTNQFLAAAKSPVRGGEDEGTEERSSPVEGDPPPRTPAESPAPQHR